MHRIPSACLPVFRLGNRITTSHWHDRNLALTATRALRIGSPDNRNAHHLALKVVGVLSVRTPTCRHP
ncbi:MAG: hypothetical protein RL345_981 [Chloroflexota bacterium]